MNFVSLTFLKACQLKEKLPYTDSCIRNLPLLKRHKLEGYSPILIFIRRQTFVLQRQVMCWT